MNLDQSGQLLQVHRGVPFQTTKQGVLFHPENDKRIIKGAYIHSSNLKQTKIMSV